MIGGNDDSGKPTPDDGGPAAGLPGDEAERDRSTERERFRRIRGSGRSLLEWLDGLVWPSRQRLSGDRETLAVEVETVGELLQGRGEATFRVDAARTLLEAAGDASDRNDMIEARQYLFAAERWHLLAVHQLDEARKREKAEHRATDGSGQVSEPPGPTGLGDGTPDATNDVGALRIRAWRIRAEAADTLTGWRKQAVERLLDEGPDETLVPDELLAASRILHEYHIDREVRRRLLNYQFVYFIGFTLLSVGLLLAYALVDAPVPAFGESGFTGFTLQGPVVGDIRPLVGAGAALDDSRFLIPVVLFGVLGASVSGILSIAREFKRERLPEQFGSVWLAFARLAMGAAAALALFAFVSAGVVQIGGAPTPALVLAVAFAAGFSERLLVRAVKAVSGGEEDEAGAASLFDYGRPPRPGR